MKASSISSLKKELSTLPAGDVLEICLKLVKYKKENKELLSYLLNYVDDEQGYINSVQLEIATHFRELNRSNSYYSIKGIRKILRATNKYIKFSGNRRTEVELLIWFCSKLNGTGIRIESSIALTNLYQRQIIKINKAITFLHEDLQYDYQEELKKLGL